MHLRVGFRRRLVRRMEALEDLALARRGPGPDPWNRVRFGASVLVLILLVGVIGYRILGLGLFDSIYQTGITVTTVGFDETGPESEIDQAYRIFTLFLVFFGTGGVLYTVGMIVEAFLEGSLTDDRRKRKEQRMIDQMSNHVIVAGAGRVGTAIVEYAHRHRADVVVIDRQPADDLGVPVVIGEATDEDVLHRAGVDRAHTLIAALNTDADNIYVTLTARALRPDLFIVVRTTHQTDEPKFRRAGADRVVNPHEIGGSRMGAIAMHPNVAEFMDEVLHDESLDVSIQEMTIAPASSAVGRTAGEVFGQLKQRPLLVAIRDQGAHYTSNPPAESVLEAGHVLIILGSAREITALEAALKA